MRPPDIMCTGEGCDIAKYCYRHTAVPAADQQYYPKPPFVKINDPNLRRKGADTYCEGSWVLGKNFTAYRRFSNKLKKSR